MLVVAYLASYAVGAVVSFVVLRRTVGGLQGGQLLRFLVRMAIVLVAAGAATWLVEWSLAGLGDRPGPLVALFRGGLSGLAGGIVLLVGAVCCGSGRSPAWSTPSRRACGGPESP